MQIVILDTVNPSRAIAIVQVWVYQNIITDDWQYVHDSSGAVVARVKTY